MAIEKRGADTYRIGFQTLNADGTYNWVRETFHATPGLSEAYQRMEAEVALERLKLQAQQAKDNPEAAEAQPNVITVRTFAERWMEKHVRPNCSPVTYKDYRYFLDSRILPYMGDMPVKKLTATYLVDWLEYVRNDGRRSTRMEESQLANPRHPAATARLTSDAQRTRPLGARTVQHYYDTLKTMLDMAVQWEIIYRNPMERVTRPRARKARVKFLDEEQAVELLRCLKDEPNMCLRAAVLLALLCGLRLGEVGALRLSDVDWRRGTIDISHALKYTPQTGSFEGPPKSEAGERIIALPVGMMAVLDQTRAYQEDCKRAAPHLWVGEGWIVHAWNGAQLHHDTPSRWFRHFADAHGFEGVRFHDLRHTHASTLLANGIDAVAVASRMGHEDASTTLRVYAHALRRRDDDAARVWQSFLDAASAQPETPDPLENDGFAPSPDAQ